MKQIHSSIKLSIYQPSEILLDYIKNVFKGIGNLTLCANFKFVKYKKCQIFILIGLHIFEPLYISISVSGSSKNMFQVNIGLQQYQS